MSYYNKFPLLFSSGMTAAQTYIVNSGITDATYKTKIIDLFNGLDTYNLMSKISALYLLRGGSASKTKLNAINPLNTDAAFRLGYSGGLTYNSTGVQGNGTNGFANTYFVPSVEQDENSKHIAIFSNTAIPNGAPDVGAVNGGFYEGDEMYIRYTDGSAYVGFGLYTGTGIVTPVADGSGFFVLTRNGNDQVLWRNNVSIGTQTTASIINVAYSNLIWGRNFTGTDPDGYSDGEYGLVSFGSYLDATDIANYTTLANAFMS